MAVYNCHNFLPEALDSIASQTLAEIEFLVADDDSTDRTWTTLQDYAAPDSRLIVNSQEDGGLTITLNALVSKARGKFLARMCGDDIALADKLQKQCTFLYSHTECVAVGSTTIRMDAKGRPIGPVEPPTSRIDIDQKNLRGFTSMHHTSVIMRAEAFRQVGGYDENIYTAQDLNLWLRLAEIGTLANIAEPLLKYRLHRNSISVKKRAIQRANARAACEMAWARRGLSDIKLEADYWRADAQSTAFEDDLVRTGWQA
ncbi:MAG: glycosyltransferase [Pseudomonadota bacterium]